MVDIFLYITLGIFLIGVALMFLGIITFVKSRYPVNGRLGLTTFYLIMAAVCFYTSLGWVGFIWIGASILMMIDLKIYEMKQNNRK